MRHQLWLFLGSGLFLLVLTALLIGLRLDTSWTNGSGYAPQTSAQIVAVEGEVRVEGPQGSRALLAGDLIKRGEWVLTGTTSRAHLTTAGSGFALDENTDWQFQNLAGTRYRGQLRRGRMLIDWQAPEKTLVVKTAVAEATVAAGRLSVINYNFKNQASFIPLANWLVINIPGQSWLTDRPTNIEEVPPFSSQEFIFDPTQSAAAEFYRLAETWLNPIDTENDE